MCATTTMAASPRAATTITVRTMHRAAADTAINTFF